MARIDLSQLNINPIEMGRQQQVFSNEGAGAYNALAGLGQNMAAIATDLYAKQQDVDTDREAQAAYSKFEADTAKHKEWALLNIDEQTNFVKGTEETFDQHMYNYREDQANQIKDSLSQSLTQQKFYDLSKSKIRKENIQDIYTSVNKVKENTLGMWKKKTSAATDGIMLSSAATTDSAYQKALEDMNIELPTIEKTIGTEGARIAKEFRAKDLIETKIKANLRNAESSDSTESQMAADSFSKTLGPALMFKDFGEYKKYVQAKTDAYLAQGPNKEAEQVIKDTMDYLTNGKAAQEFMTFKPDPNAQLLSNDEKSKYLDKFLDIKFKNAKKGYDAVEKQLGDWEKNSAAKGTPADITEFQTIVKDPHFKGDNVTIVRDVKAAAWQALLKDAHADYVSSGGTSMEGWKQKMLPRMAEYEQKYIGSVMSKSDFDKVVSTYPSVGISKQDEAEKALEGEAQKWRTEMNTNPIGAIIKTPDYTDKLSSAFVTKSDGTMLFDKNGINQFRSYWMDQNNKIGTVMSTIEKENLIPAPMAKAISEKIKMETPQQQVESYKSLNEVGPQAAMSYYKQAMEKDGMTLQEANMLANMRTTDSPTRDAMNARLISLRNKFTGEAGQKYIKQNLMVEGMFGRDHTFTDVEQEIDSQLKNNEYMQNLKTVARASGMSEDQIQIMYSNENVRLLILDNLTSNPPSGGFFSTLGGRIKPAVDRAINDFFNTTPVIGENVKAILPDTSPLKEEEIKNNAAKATEEIKKGLEDGRYKIDFSDYNLSNRGKASANLSQELKQSIFLKDTMDSLSFNSADVTGRSPELYLMFQGKDGNSYRLKLMDASGKGQTLIANPEDLDAKTIAKKLDRFNQSKIIGEMKQAEKSKPGMAIPDALAPKATGDIYEQAFKFLKPFEGFTPRAKASYEGGATSRGFGHKDQAGENLPSKLTPAQGKELAIKDLKIAEEKVNKYLTVPVSPEIKTVLMDMAYNLKETETKTPVKNTIEMINKGDMEGALNNIKKMTGGTNAKGEFVKEIPNQVKRTNARVALFKSGMAKAKNEQVLFGNFKGLQ